MHRFLNKMGTMNTSSGYQTPGFVLPSRTAITNAAVAVPAALKDAKVLLKAFNCSYFSHTFLFSEIKLWMQHLELTLIVFCG